MEFKGTKGVWTVERREDTVYDQEVFAISAAGYDEFITVWNGMEQLEKQQEANALLISKAPEMLEMLNRFMEITRELNHPRLDHLRGSANKLIKEATELCNKKH